MLYRAAHKIRRMVLLSAVAGISAVAGAPWTSPTAHACIPLHMCIEPCYEEMQACQADCARQCGRYQPWY